MDDQNHSIKPHKNKHLKFKERMIIRLRLQDGFTPYKIAKELNRSINTVLNEIRRGSTLQIKQGKLILFIKDWMNTFPRKILNYNSPKQLFDNHLNQIYAI